ncbi:MAG TPA: formylglycine-generating enzyme family protein [Anaerolineales bacterium]
MKRLIWILLMTILVTACAPASTSTPAPTSTASALPPTSQPTATSVPATSAPTLAPVSLAGPSAGTTMTWMDGSVLVYIPSGEFIMGLGYGDAPTKTVTLDAYWIQQTEVTNKTYAQCVASGNCSAPVQEVGAAPLTAAAFGDYPVVGITWDAANKYCQWIGGQLPSEAQWEKAARGQSGNKYPWGNNSPKCSLANFLTCGGHTSTVNSYPDGKSSYGLLDMEGNVYEWVNDYYDPNYYSTAPSSNPTGPSTGDHRVIRGSSFETDVSQLLSAIRHPSLPDYHNYDLGFRCVVTQPPAFAPYCQSASYLPIGGTQTQNATCSLPNAQVGGNYCQGPNSYATVNLPQGATYQVQSKDFSCEDAVVNGQRTLTCTGPSNSSANISICNTACNASSNSAGASAACDPGYNLDTSTNACIYTPITGQPGVAGCPQGYNLIDRGGQKICVIGQNQNGQCPAGLYFDSQYGACVSATGQADAPYGIDNPDLATKNYQGCASGYSYNSTYQCCQAKTGGTYPGCPLGFTFDSTQKTCLPSQVNVSSNSCVSVQVNTVQCGTAIDPCAQFTSKGKAICIRSACFWNEKTSPAVCQSARP